MFIFVYGTLKSAYKELNAFTKAFHLDATWLCDATIQGNIYLMDWYPALHLIGSNLVYGEIYKIHTPSLLATIDIYEEACDEEDYKKLDSFHKTSFEYIRKRITINEMECWVYEYLGEVDTSKRIESGVFEME